MNTLLPSFLDYSLCPVMLVVFHLTLAMIQFTLVCFVTTWYTEDVSTYLVSLRSPDTHIVSLSLPPFNLVISLVDFVAILLTLTAGNTLVIRDANMLSIRNVQHGETCGME